ncbi:Zinc finger, C3HC4 type (RING finger) [Rhizoctonia solani]|uniref:Zinc finger, C3HC4 type (RING finger) n=1 Tax=Rhizoctonia solani TaxID=456999 RepID=A0A8H7II37_9AGAM|nr:Zinc finger, C3HC4 type (RING finger) [Rhizoctonia solani]
MSALLEHFKPPPLASDPPAKTKYWPAPPKGSTGGILQRSKAGSIAASLSSNGSPMGSPVSRVSFAPLPDVAAPQLYAHREWGPIFILLLTRILARDVMAIPILILAPHPVVPGGDQVTTIKTTRQVGVIDLGEVAIDAGKKLWRAISRKPSMASDSGRPNMHSVHRSHPAHGEMGGPTVGAMGHNTEREISVRGFAVPEDDEEESDDDEEDEEEDDEEEEEEAQHRTEDYVAGVQAMHISVIDGEEEESIQPDHIRPTRLSPPPLTRSETDSSASAASTPSQSQEQEPPAVIGKDSLTLTRTPTTDNTHARILMDALRSLPQSLSAVRANLRHIVSELVGGKVEISYVPAPSSTPLPSPSPSPSPTLGPQPPVDKMPSPWGFMTSGPTGSAPQPNHKRRSTTAPKPSPTTILPPKTMAPVSSPHQHISHPYPFHISCPEHDSARYLFVFAYHRPGTAADIWEPLDMEPGRIWYLELCRWAAEKEMAYVCWTTYLAVCVAMVMNTLTRGLEGVASEGPHAFNLLSILHVLAINKRLSRQRLIPTTVCGLLSITHFTYVTLFSKSAYPFFTYLNSLLEAFLVGIIVLTGRFVWNPFAEEDGLAHQSLLPSRSDDYAVALLKLGSACIEVTAMAGFGNEVGVPGPYFAPTLAELTHWLQVSPIHTPDTIYISHSGPIIPKLPNAPSGLAREIKSVGRFGERVARVAKGVWGAVTRRERAREERGRVVARPKVEGEVYDIREVYARYLLGEEIVSDDEDDEFRPGAEAEDSESDLDGLSEDDEEEQEEQEEQEEGEEEEEDVSAPTLYADLARRSLPPQSRSRESSPSVPALTPMLIAHLTSPSKTPLTRNKYTALSYPPTTLIAPSSRESLSRCKHKGTARTHGRHASCAPSNLAR